MEDEKNTGFHKYLLIVICFVGQIQIQISNVAWLSFVFQWQLHIIAKHALQILVIFRNKQEKNYSSNILVFFFILLSHPFQREMVYDIFICHIN